MKTIICQSAFLLASIYASAQEENPSQFVDTWIGSRGSGNTVIKAENLSKENICVAEAFLNGKPLKQAWLRHSQIIAGGELTLKMSKNPDNSWIETPPPSPLSDLKNQKLKQP